MRTIMGALILSPLIVPGIVVAIGIYYVFARYRPGRNAGGSCAGAHLPCRAVRRYQRQRQPGGSRSPLGTGGAQSRRDAHGARSVQVTLPLIRPGVLVGALFAFITSFDELIVALFLSGSGAITLPRRMWDDLRFAIDPTIAAVSTLTIALSAMLLLGAHLVRRHQASEPGGTV